MILDKLIFPDKCPFCDNLTSEKEISEGKCGACPECEKHVHFFEKGGNGRLKGLECAPACDRIYCLFRYAGRAKNAVRKYKFSGQLWIGKLLADGIYKMLDEENVFDECFYITYVPVSGERFAERGFDQSEILAKSLAEKSGRTLLPVLKRNFQGARSSESNLEERELSGKNKYSAEEKFKPYLIGKTVLLVDDILTTGSTIEECAACLKNAGCGKVYAVTAASGRRDV